MQFNIIGVFRGVFEGFTGLVEFLNTPIVFDGWNIVMSPTQEQTARALQNGAVTPLMLLGALIGAFLLVTFLLHLAHLINPIG